MQNHKAEKKSLNRLFNVFNKRGRVGYIFAPNEDIAKKIAMATAVATVLYDRRMKRQLAGLEEIKPASQILNEQRGFDCDLESEENHSPYNAKRNSA